MNAISSRAEYRQQDRCFDRTQSREMAAREWEGRTPALKAWGPHIAAAIGMLLLLCLAFPAAEVVVGILAWSP